jgi:putative membrane protein insertion efficiency factor
MTVCIPSLPQLFLIGFLLLFGTVDACQSCLFPPLHSVRHHHHAPTAVAVALQQRPPSQLSSPFYLGLVALKNLQKPIVKPVAIAVGVLITQRCMSAVLRAAEEATAKDDEEPQEDDQEESKPMTQAMVATIGVYKNFISPLLPPACRFFPTCSQYGVQAIENFGPTKGSILTAWRLLRCSPLGGKGYDPPKWPPVFYTYGSY